MGDRQRKRGKTKCLKRYWIFWDIHFIFTQMKTVNRFIYMYRKGDHLKILQSFG